MNAQQQTTRAKSQNGTLQGFAEAMLAHTPGLEENDPAAQDVQLLDPANARPVMRQLAQRFDITNAGKQQASDGGSF